MSDVYIYRGFLDGTLSVISDPFLLFYGTIDEYKISDNTTTANINLSVTSHWGNFSKTSGRTTSDNSQQGFFLGIRVWSSLHLLLEILNGVEYDKCSFIPSRKKDIENIYDLLVEFKEIDLEVLNLPRY